MDGHVAHLLRRISRQFGERFSPFDVFGFGPNDVWIVGIGDTTGITPPSLASWPGFVMRFDGSQWTGTRLPGGEQFFRVWGSTSSDVWLGGTTGRMYHYDGETYAEYRLPDSAFVSCLGGPGGSTVFAGTFRYPFGHEFHTLYSWDGSSWSFEAGKYPREPSPGFYPIFTFYGGSMFTVNEEVVVKRKAPRDWEVQMEDPEANMTWIDSHPALGIIAFGYNIPGELLYHGDGNSWVRIDSLSRADAHLGRSFMLEDAVFITSVDRNPDGTFWPKSHVVVGR